MHVFSHHRIDVFFKSQDENPVILNENEQMIEIQTSPKFGSLSSTATVAVLMQNMISSSQTQNLEKSEIFNAIDTELELSGSVISNCGSDDNNGMKIVEVQQKKIAYQGNFYFVYDFFPAHFFIIY